MIVEKSALTGPSVTSFLLLGLKHALPRLLVHSERQLYEGETWFTLFTRIVADRW